ncbi:thioredoxin family protein [Aliiglaciecola sp. LCG003]|uniref:thioredoxin family protein n=1 Tax=Aliiglaciecola sp. LCG003 TaxID=3053655 RepID=UPI00257324D9|nr:thioredoxin family protein [Aliiglaciecola sp. LCG003]WJG09164.1 thioredoxin family protein [Aliiglaciecola sp. LCG003]
MKLLLILGSLIGLIMPLPVSGQSQATDYKAQDQCFTVEVFSKKSCPHCQDAYQFLEDIAKTYPQLTVVKRDVEDNQDNLQHFIWLNTRYQIDMPGVPSFYACGQFWVGFEPSVTLNNLLLHTDLAGKAPLNQHSNPEQSISLPFIGQITAGQYGLPLFTLMTGLLDGFNPCAMWVLMFLLSLLVNVRDRKRMLLIAGTFVIVSGVVYFAFMAAWLNLFLIIGISRNIQVVIALVALIVGSINIKDYFAFKQGITLGIPESSKAGLYEKVRGIVQAKNISTALFAVVVVAILVNLLELICTAGLPAIYTQVLTLQQLQPMQYYAYLLLYNLAYIFDDALMVGVVVFTLQKYKLSERQGRWLKLISGCFILALGGLLLLKPEYLF